jgi:excisionase family DNA binding protein
VKPARDVLTVAEAAARTPFSTKTILRALVAGELVGSKVRNRWLIRLNDLDAWLDSGRRGAVNASTVRTRRPTRVGSAARLREIEDAA